MKADYTMTENGITVKDSISVQISIRMMYPPEEIVILQMGEDSAVISRGEYKPGEVPERMIPEEETAYWIAETAKGDFSTHHGYGGRDLGGADQKLSPHFAPASSSKAYYADINFDLLGEILEKITQLPLEKGWS